MSFLLDVLTFLVVLTIVVFVHELGHYLVARWNGVKIEVFSIGFGPELVGRTDQHGTRWCISAIPMGGYVKMFGDADASSSTAEPREMSDAEKAVSYHHKRVGQRAAVSVAGPAANFIFAILAMTVMFLSLGQQVGEPVVGQVMADSAAAEAGLKPGDAITAINGSVVTRFDDVRRMVVLMGLSPITIDVMRDGSPLEVTASPKVIERKSWTGEDEKVPVLGVAGDPAKFTTVHHNPISAFTESLRQTRDMVGSTLIGIGQMISGTRSADELGGPIKIAKGASQAAKLGFSGFSFFVILLSVNLGLFNLFPIPVLDGGHLLFYGFEAILGRPLGERVQEYGFRIGMFLVLALMLFATRNDLVSLPIWQAVKRIIF